jgi:hypothetical protein
MLHFGNRNVKLFQENILINLEQKEKKTNKNISIFKINEKTKLNLKL